MDTPTLRFLTGPSAGHLLLIERERVVLGRADSVDVTVPDQAASREHAAITREGDVWRLQDLKSRHGTQLNGRPLTAPAALKAGDRIRVGETDLEFAVVGAAAAGTRLELVEGPGAPKTFAVPGSVAVLGRGPKAQIDLGTEAEEPGHAQLAERDGAWRLRPGKGCAVFVNGERLTGSARLKTGDRVRIGRCALDFVDGRTEQLAGQEVEGCALATRIGCGSLGVVWRARDQAGKELAVKLLDPGLRGDAGAAARFVAGARAQMRVSHPNVVAIHAAGQAQALPAAVMESMPGGSLAERLEGGARMDAKRVLALAKNVVDGLRAAAERGVHHQGLRPGNILFDADGVALVGDFALCAPYDPLAPSEGGDPRWIAPEEARGGAADVRSNQFSLALILLQCLSGRPPFGAGGRAEIAQARLAGVLPALRALAPDAPVGVERLLGRMLARDPANRFADWNEVRTALDGVAAGGTLPAPPSDTLLGGKAPSAVVAAATPRERPASSSSTRAPEQRGSTERLRAASTARVVARPAPSLSRELGIPASAWAGIGILALMLVAIIAISSMRSSPRAPDPVTAPAAPAPPRPMPSGSAARGAVPAPVEPAAPSAQPAGPAGTPVAAPAMPTLAPEVLLVSAIGAKGDQGIDSVGFDPRGRVTAIGAGFTATVDAVTGTGTIHGDPAASPDVGRLGAPAPVGRIAVMATPGQVAGETVRDGITMLPRIDGPGWSWWSLDAARATELGLGAQARLQGLFAVPGDRFIAVVWAEGANSVLARDPLDPEKPMTAGTADGAATWVLLADAADGRVRKALVLPGPACACLADPWGRVWLGASLDGSDDLGFSGRAGVLGLGHDLEPLLDAPLGGMREGEDGFEWFSSMALRDGVLALGGTSAASKPATRKPLQAKPGGGQDGLLVVMKLWEAPKTAAPGGTRPAPAAP